MNIELKPCPFCGGEGKFDTSYWTKTGKHYSYVRCSCCNAKSGSVFAHSIYDFDDLDPESQAYKKAVKISWDRADRLAASAWNTRQEANK